jgi:hypothetical protein
MGRRFLRHSAVWDIRSGGFGRFEILPIENDFYRFYLMT